MKKRWIVMSAVLAGFLLFIGTARASWVYMFVVFNGSAYAISDSQIAPDRIGAKLGIVTSYSDHEEEAHSGNFSNRYPKGTPYYRIQGIEINQAIAVKEAEGVFVKAE